MSATIHKKVILAYLGVILIWSTTPLAINWSVQDVHFLYGVTWRMVIGLFCLLFVMWIKKRNFSFDNLSLGLYLFSGLSIYTSMMTVYYGSLFINSSMVALVFAFSTFVTGVFSVVWLKEKSFQTNKTIGLLLAIMGLFSIFYQPEKLSESLGFGVFWVMVSVVIYSFSGVMFKKFTKEKHIDALVVTAGSLIVASVLFLLTLFIVEGKILPINASPKMLWATLYLGVAGSALGYVLYMFILKSLQANQVALLALVTPVVAMYLGMFFNNELINNNQVWGTAFVLAGLVAYNLKRSKRLKP